MRTICFVCLFFVSLAALLIVVAAQPNSAAHNQPVSLRDESSRIASALAQPAVPLEGVPFGFKKPKHYNGGENHAIAIADLNGDGYLDLVTTYYDLPSSVAVLLGNADGTFQAPAHYSSGGNFADSVTIGDVNGDGHPDLIVANMCGDGCEGGVGVLLGNGDGTFKPVMTYDSGGFEVQSVAVGDVNGDGKLDVVVANYRACESCDNMSTVSVLLGNGDGTFESPVSYGSAGSLANSVAIADVNGDGYPDVVVSNQCQIGDCNFIGPVGVLLGKGDGTFQSAVTYSSGGFEYSIALAVRDLNGDGHPDIVVANWCQDSSCSSGGVSVLLGNGDGSFQAPITYNAGAAITVCVAIADVNGDGLMDLVVNNGATSEAVNVLLGNGDGTFQSPVSFSTRAYPVSSIVIADLNHDGRPDIITGAEIVSVLLNNSSSQTGTTLVSSVNPSSVNQSVTFTATVTSSIPLPNGSSVDFDYGKTVLGTGTTLNGVARFTTSFPKAKTYIIRAIYPGDAFHKASSGNVKQVVNR